MAYVDSTTVSVRATAIALLLGAVLGTSPRAASATCVGDCDGTGMVSVINLVKMVNIALGTFLVSTCTAGDADNSGDVDVTEIITAVGNALNGCAPMATATPTPTPTATTNLTPSPTLGPLGTRHFTIRSTTSPFIAVLGEGLAIPLANFQGQTNGVTGGAAFLDLEAGQPDANGLATLNITAASDYIYADASGLAQLVLCLKPVVPVMSAGLIACNGGFDFSIALNINHNLGQIGVGGFTFQQCNDRNGSVESANQICGAGMIGEPCRKNSECDSAAASGDGVCGLAAAKCTTPEEKDGTACQADADCDTTADSADGTCGQPGVHPGVCNGPFQGAQTGILGVPGSVTIAPLSQLGLNGLPVELSIEKALPCGDEGTNPAVTAFALTSTLARSTVFNFSNQTDVCSAGKVSSDCMVNADCDSAVGMGDGVCGATLTFESHGTAFSCTDWQNPTGPGCLVLTAPQLDANPSGGDIITSFKFCGR